MGKGNPNPKNKFTKGDPRINRKGRPKSFDQLSKLAREIAYEIVVHNDGTQQTRLEKILLELAVVNPVKFLEIGFGRIPQHIDVTANINGRLKVVAYDYATAIKAICADDDIENEQDSE